MAEANPALRDDGRRTMIEEATHQAFLENPEKTDAPVGLLQWSAAVGPAL